MHVKMRCKYSLNRESTNSSNNSDIVCTNLGPITPYSNAFGSLKDRFNI